MPSVCTWSGGTAAIEVKPLAVTVPALILMEAHIIAHAIKEVQMLSGSAHIVISQCNTSLIFVVVLLFHFFPHRLPPTLWGGELDMKLCGIVNDRGMNPCDSGQMFPIQHLN